jgi:undecaprenyl-phosphate 4-deoxy-4-formamido-L-arabinose transferase
MEKKLSIVIPIYNSQHNLPPLMQSLTTVLSSLPNPYEIILVNDGSHDQTWQTVKELSNKYPNIRAFDLMRNYGQHNALLCGIREASGEIIITMDDDLQHPPEAIPQLLAKLHEGYDVVYSVPQEEKHSLWRNITSKLIKLILKKAMRVSKAQQISAFRAFYTQLRDSFAEYKGTFVSIDVLLSWGTTRFASVKTKHNSRLSGHSQYTFKKLLSHALTLITGFSILPLQFSSLLGFASILFGIAVLIYVFIRFLQSGGIVPGFTFLASIIAIFAGVQLFAIGMIGEYLGRLFSRTLGQPTYIIRQQEMSQKTENIMHDENEGDSK